MMPMSYKEEMAKYINLSTGLVGLTPNKADYSSGNCLLETGTAYVFLKRLDYITAADLYSLGNAIASCKQPLNPFYSKNPGTDDFISHDDIIGIYSGWKAAGDMISLRSIAGYGKKRLWLYSTTGRLYWDAITKPWHRAYYTITSSGKATLGDSLILGGYLAIDALFNKNNSSDKKLAWLMVQGVENKSVLLDRFIYYWYNKTYQKWGSIRNVFKTYYGEDHVFTRYCWE